MTVTVRVSIRPWPLSSVSAHVVSGGNATGAPAASQGGKIAEALGDGGFQLGLVVLDRYQVVLAVGDDLFGQRPLGEQGIPASSSRAGYAANNSASDATTVVGPNLSTSTKTVVDQNGGDPDPGDTLRYTLTLVETGKIVCGISSLQREW